MTGYRNIDGLVSSSLTIPTKGCIERMTIMENQSSGYSLVRVQQHPHMASNKKSYDSAHDHKQELTGGYRHSERFEADACLKWY